MVETHDGRDGRAETVSEGVGHEEPIASRAQDWRNDMLTCRTDGGSRICVIMACDLVRQVCPRGSVGSEFIISLVLNENGGLVRDPIYLFEYCKVAISVKMYQVTYRGET